MSYIGWEALERRALLAAGGLDTRFDGDGLWISSPDFDHKVTFRSDSALLIAGATIGGTGVNIYCYKPDGTLDRSFDGDGRLTTTRLKYVSNMMYQPDGKLLVFGTVPAGDARPGILRLNANGSVDTAWGTNGVADPGMGLSGDVVDAIIMPDGKLLMTGRRYVQTPDVLYPSLAISRLMPNGSLDTSFNGTGTRFELEKIGGWFSGPAYNINEDHMRIIPQPNGRILLAVQMGVGIFGGYTQFFMRFNADGTSDNTLYYGFGSTIRYDPTTAADVIDDVIPQADGTFLAVGKYNGAYQVMKFNGGGQLLAQYGNPLGTQPIEQFVADGTGRFIVSSSDGSGNFSAKRINAAGQVDPNYTAAAAFGKPLFALDDPGEAAAAPDGSLALAVLDSNNGDGRWGVIRFTGDTTTPPPPPPPPNQTGTISGVTFDDSNKNGLLDTGETKTSGKTVFLDSNNNGKLDSGEKSTKTSTTGAYSFTNLTAGTYYVRRVFPSGYTYSNLPLNLTLAGGQNITNANIGSVPVGTPPPPPPPPPGQTGSISGFTFDDKNKNGLLDSGETKTSGKTVFLDTNNNGKLDSGEKSTKTNTSGAFSFTNLSAGTYYVRRVFPSGYTYSNLPLNLALAAGQSITNANIGSIAGTVTPPPPPPPPPSGDPKTASISGFLFWDNDRDGKFDTGESYQASKTVFIDLDDDNVLDSNEKKLTTDSKGAFKFTGLAAGTYVIKRVVPSGYKITTPKAVVTLSAGQVFSGVAIGTNSN